MLKYIFMFQIYKLEVINILKYRDIEKFYDIVDINNGKVITKNKRISIYKIKPCNVINRSDEFENQIYSAYLSAIRMINFNHQILIETKKLDFKNIFDKLDKNIYLTDEYKQKEIVQEYKNYMMKISKDINVYNRTFYLIVDELDMEKEKRLKEAFSFLENVGIKIKKITDNDRLYKLLYETINRI